MARAPRNDGLDAWRRQIARGVGREELRELLLEEMEPAAADEAIEVLMPINLPKTSPYRFLALNDVVLPAPKVVEHDVPEPGGFSGRIVVDWVAETPLLIGVERGKGNQAEVVPLTLGTNLARFAIPGATIKGLLRAGVEAVTLGRLTQLNRDHQFGLRDFNDPYYREDQNGISRLQWNSVKAGWLEKREATEAQKAAGQSDYVITECCKYTIQIRGLPATMTSGADRDARHLDWLKRTLRQKYASDGSTIDNDHFAPGNAYGFVLVAPGGTDVVPADGPLCGHYVFSGRLPLPTDLQAAVLGQQDAHPGKKQYKKREYVFVDRAGATHFRLDTVAFGNFERMNGEPSGRGITPTGSWKVLQPIVENGGRVPVFWVGTAGGKDFSFGLTRTFKLAQPHSVGEVLARTGNGMHLPRRRMQPDWAGSLFGHVFEDGDFGPDDSADVPDGAATPPSSLARKGRVAVGFATVAGPTPQVFPAGPAPAIRTTMMGPRASFAPHHLVGPEKHWSSTNENTRLAGRKRWFPRFAPAAADGGAWPAAQAMVQQDTTLPADDAGERTVSRLRFLVPAPGAELRFRGELRVHNLLAQEVGALLWVLTHGGREDRRHMLGRAKPFGAGQMRVEAIALEALAGHDAAADARLVPQADGRVPVQPFLKDFVTAMDAALAAAGASGRWIARPEVQDWLGLADPAWGARERAAGRANYPGAVDTGRGKNMRGGPKAHGALRKALTGGAGPFRWLRTPRDDS